MNYKLYSYQQEAIDFALKNKNVLLWVARGAGKTLIAIELMQYHNVFPVLIVTPASVKTQFEAEIRKFWKSDPDIKIQNFQAGTRLDPNADIVIINPDILDRYKESLRNMCFQGGIYDESHYFKNHKAKRSKALIYIGSRMKYRVAMTGTAITKAPIDLFSQFQIVKPHIFGNKTRAYPDRVMDWYAFARKYSGGHDGYFGFECKEATNVEELQQRTRNLVFRKKVEDILTELPPVLEIPHHVGMNEKQEAQYSKLSDDFENWLEDQGHTDYEIYKKLSAEGIVKLNECRKFVSEVKVKHAVEMAKDMFNEKKVLLFCSFTDTALALKEALGDEAITVIGSDSEKKRADNIKAFKEFDSVKYAIINIQAGGVGLNLQESHNIIFVDLPFNYSDFDQCVGRAHRRGQENHVNVYKMMVSNTVDEKINKYILTKEEFRHIYEEKSI